MNFVIETSSGVRSIAINRPEKRNTLSLAMMKELANAFAEAQTDNKVRAVVLQGLPEIFSAGADLLEPGTSADRYATEARLLAAADALQKPLLAAINGPAVGLAVLLLLSCDLVYCGKRALFSLPFTALGETPSHAASYRLAAACGRHLASEKLLLSEPISAEEAFNLRLVNGVFEDSETVRQTAARALRLAKLPPQALKATKLLIRRATEPLLAAELDFAKITFEKQANSAEFKTAREAFLEGRRPNFSNED